MFPTFIFYVQISELVTVVITLGSWQASYVEACMTSMCFMYLLRKANPFPHVLQVISYVM